MNKPKLKITFRNYLSYAIFIIGLALVSIDVYAKGEVSVSGVVLDENKKPLVGVTVSKSDTGGGTITNSDGTFSVKALPGSKLTFSYIGYNPQIIKVTNQSNLVIILESNDITMDDVVVVGYGVKRKETLTGAITSIQASDIVKTKSSNLALSLQGNIPGLSIRQNNGEPGRFATEINMRGLGTPIFVVDGVIRDGVNEFARMNSEDIESISFLKDGAAAIYGMNSSNGAVVVTTKKGGKGKPSITLTSNVGFASPANIPKMANAAQHQTMLNEAHMNVGRSYLTKEELAKWQTGAPGYESYDYYNSVFNNVAAQTQNTLSVSGGSENTSYYTSIGYAGENSLLKNNALTYDKYTIRSNVSFVVAKNLTASINLGGRYDRTERPYDDMFNILKWAQANTPTRPLYANNNKAYYNNLSLFPNPLAAIDKELTGYGDERNYSILTQTELKYSVPQVKGLEVKATLFYDYETWRHKFIKKEYDLYSYSPEDEKYNPITFNSPSTVADQRREDDRIAFQGQINYNRRFEKHNIGATYVFEVRKEQQYVLNGSREYAFYTFPEIDAAGEKNMRVDGSTGRAAYVSHIGRISYDYASKYLLDATLRYDGSYRYAPNSRWALLPSVSIGWRLSEEGFIKNNLQFIDNLKLRGSVSQTGTDAGSPFEYVTGYHIKNGGYIFDQGTFIDGVALSGTAKSNLTWMKAVNYNVGLDLSIFHRMLVMEFDLFQRDVSGIPAHRNVQLPNTFGASLAQENLNSNRALGYELQLSHYNKVSKDFSYSLSGNISYSRIKNRYVEQGNFRSSMERWRGDVSDRYGFIWGYDTDGRFSSMDQIYNSPVQSKNGNGFELPGDYIIEDTNGDGVIDGSDMVPKFHGGYPLLHYGFNMSFQYKGFDFYALLQGAAKSTLSFEETYAKMLFFNGGNTPEYFYDRWHKADIYDPNSEWIPGKYPAVRLETEMGAFYLKDTPITRKNASYLRLKTIEIGYTFNAPKMREKVGIESIRVYFNANNILTFADSFVKPFDPEKSEGSASAGFTYPLNKTYNIGLKLNF